MLGEGRPRTRPFGPKRKVGRPKNIHRNLELEAAIKAEKQSLPVFGPKRKAGRPRKPVDYVTNYVPPLLQESALIVPKPKGKKGRSKKQAILAAIEPFFF